MKKIFIPLCLLLVLLLQGCTAAIFSPTKTWLMTSTKYAETPSLEVTFKLRASNDFYEAVFEGTAVLALPSGSALGTYKIDNIIKGVKLGATTIYFPSDSPFSSDPNEQLMIKKGYYYVEIKGDKMSFYETPDQGQTKGDLAVEFVR